MNYQKEKVKKLTCLKLHLKIPGNKLNQGGERPICCKLQNIDKGN